MPVHLTNRQRRFPVNPDTLVDQAQMCLDTWGIGHVSLSILLVNDRGMRPLNQTYRGINRATDVLSFPMFEGLPKDIIATLNAGADAPVAEEIGDVVISVERAHAQAGERNIPVTAELALLLVHGILHLLGHDHETGADDAANMLAAESDLLQHLGLKHPGLISRADGP